VRTGSKVFRLCLDHHRAGAEMARYLADLGHRHIAFLTHLSSAENPWLPERLRGISTVFPLHRTAHERTMTVYQCREMESDSGLRGLRTALRSTLSEVLGNPAWAQGLPQVAIQKELLRVVEQTALNAVTANTMREVFASALQETRITAWVCVNDRLAIAAREFLNRSNIAVPDRLSLVGFDNHSLGQVMGLTTYDFRYQTLGAIAVECIARPLAVKSKNNTIVLEGTLLPRRSTGRAPIVRTTD
jgi:DNA-binding LacI/PurR family transcriptional regulator